MGILSGNPINEPMHYGEVMGAWSYLIAGKGAVASFQTLINHTGDADLKELLEEAVKLAKQEGAEVEKLLKENEVGLPPTPPERPKAQLEEIPVGAKYMDMEIAAMLAASTSACLVACSGVMAQCVREDVAAMFGKFHLQKAAFGLKVLRLNKQKGWLIPPPLHNVGGKE
ncbi:MAG: hypothetical protein K0R71_1880 [Bacillales bacterium]|jgi:hypothetical protein|nr:hypothetical protein [Bacillales bacterium]